MRASWTAKAPAAAPVRRCQFGKPSLPAHVCRANYRWSAEAGGGRKRESLYGYGEDGEPRNGGGSAGANGAANQRGSAAQGAQEGTSGDAAAAAWQQGEWDQRAQGGADADAQQAAWEAAAAVEITSERLERRRAQRAGGSGGGRLSQRRQRLEQQQQEAQQQGQEQQQQGQEQQQAQLAEPAATWPEAAGGDPWVEAELRQLRRQQRPAAGLGSRGRAAAAAAGGTGPAEEPAGPSMPPDPLAAEWGPLSAVPGAAAAEAEDYGWAAESWAQDEGGRQQGQGQRQQGEEQQRRHAGPGSSWGFLQQAADLRQRRRRRRRSGGADDEEAGGAAAAAAAAAAGARAYFASRGKQRQQQQRGYEPGSGGGGAQGQGQEQYSRQGQQYSDQLDDELYDELYSEDDDLADDDEEIGWQQDGRGEYSPEFEPGMTAEPDIAVLSTDELEQVLPVVPFSQQAAYFSGSATDGVQRWGASLAATVILSKVAVLAATSLTWPLWWPWALAAKKNLAVRRQYRYGGLWRTRVLGVTFTGRPKPFSSTDGGSGGGLLGGSAMRLARVLVGDPGGAQTELTLAYDARYESIQPGEPAELMVLSSDTSFQQFKAVKDVYLPNRGLWVSEYPHADRTQFLEVSLQVEREAQEAADAEQQRQQQQYSGGSRYGPTTGNWQGDGYDAQQRM